MPFCRRIHILVCHTAGCEYVPKPMRRYSPQEKLNGFLVGVSAPGRCPHTISQLHELVQLYRWLSPHKAPRPLFSLCRSLHAIVVPPVHALARRNVSLCAAAHAEDMPEILLCPTAQLPLPMRQVRCRLSFGPRFARRPADCPCCARVVLV